LNAPGVNQTQIEDALASNIRRYVTREEIKTAKPAKARA